MANETPIGVLRRSFGDSRAEQQAGQEPEKIFGIALPREINAEFFRVKKTALQCAPRRVRGLRAPRIARPRLSEHLGDDLTSRV